MRMGWWDDGMMRWWIWKPYHCFHAGEPSGEPKDVDQPWLCTHWKGLFDQWHHWRADWNVHFLPLGQPFFAGERWWDFASKSVFKTWIIWIASMMHEPRWAHLLPKAETHGSGQGLSSFDTGDSAPTFRIFWLDGWCLKLCDPFHFKPWCLILFDTLKIFKELKTHIDSPYFTT